MIIDNELVKCNVEDTLIVGYSFQNDKNLQCKYDINNKCKAGNLYTRLMSMMNQVSREQSNLKDIWI